MTMGQLGKPITERVAISSMRATRRLNQPTRAPTVTSHVEKSAHITLADCTYMTSVARPPIRHDAAKTKGIGKIGALAWSPRAGGATVAITDACRSVLRWSNDPRDHPVPVATR